MLKKSLSVIIIFALLLLSLSLCACSIYQKIPGGVYTCDDPYMRITFDDEKGMTMDLVQIAEIGGKTHRCWVSDSVDGYVTFRDYEKCEFITDENGETGLYIEDEEEALLLKCKYYVDNKNERLILTNEDKDEEYILNKVE